MYVATKNFVGKQWRKIKKTPHTAWYYSRKIAHEVYVRSPSWKVLLAILLLIIFIIAFAYVYTHHWEAVHDYYVMIKNDVNKKLTKAGKKEL
jgi:hypothetical protein